MLIENEFTVPVPIDTLWTYLLDVERIAPCMPGAELTEAVDERTWKGKVNVKLGPVSLSFAGTVAIQERDDATHRVVLAATGREQRGKGSANGKVSSWLEPGDGATTVKMRADLTLSGPVAQLSRGLLPEVSKKLTKEFAECLEAGMLAAESAAGASASTQRAKPVSGIQLGLVAVWSLIRNLFRRLFSRQPPH